MFSFDSTAENLGHIILQHRLGMGKRSAIPRCKRWLTTTTFYANQALLAAMLFLADCAVSILDAGLSLTAWCKGPGGCLN